jgi:hypothetical protein
MNARESQAGFFSVLSLECFLKWQIMLAETVLKYYVLRITCLAFCVVKMDEDCLQAMECHLVHVFDRPASWPNSFRVVSQCHSSSHEE